MTEFIDQVNGIYELAAAQCDGELTDDQAARLEQMLLGSPGLRRSYILYMQIHAAAEQGVPEAFQTARYAAGESRATTTKRSREVADHPLHSRKHSPGGVLPSFIGQPIATIYSSFGQLPITLCVAILLVGGAITIGWLGQMRNPQPVSLPVGALRADMTYQLDFDVVRRYINPTGIDRTATFRAFFTLDAADNANPQKAWERRVGKPFLCKVSDLPVGTSNWQRRSITLDARTLPQSLPRGPLTLTIVFQIEGTVATAGTCQVMIDNLSPEIVGKPGLLPGNHNDTVPQEAAQQR